MKRIDKFLLGAICTTLFAAIVQIASLGDRAYADTGHEGASRIERGSYIQTRRIILSSSTGTSLFGASIKRPDGVCRIVVEGNAVYIGTVSASLADTQTHSNISAGFAFFSSETFILDGSMTGELFATAGIGQSNVEVRCLDGLVR